MLVAMRFPAKITSSCIWVAIPVELFYIGMPVVRTDGLLGGRAVYGHVITKFSQMGRLLHFLTHGAPMARFVRESSAMIGTCLWAFQVPVELLRFFQLHMIGLP